MDISKLKVLVIGGGIGGLASACVLAQRGADVTVMEQAPAITEVGAGIQISPNGLAVLRALGLDAALAACAVQGQAVSLRDYRGPEVLRLDLGRLSRRDYYFVHRADLITLLADAARAAGVTIRLLQQVRDVVPGDVPQVILQTGEVCTADLVIGADGLHSVLRPVLNGEARPFFTGQVAWRAVVPSTWGRGGMSSATLCAMVRR